MTTTSQFQLKKDYYSTQQECLSAPREEEQTNPRYKYFSQTHFTAGDEEQFKQYRDDSNSNTCLPEISLSDNIFNSEEEDPPWDKYNDVKATAVINTFRYIFNKFKKGIFVKIQSGKLKVFLPFSKANFYNEWSHKIHVQNGTINNFIKELTEQAGYRFNPQTVNPNVNEWYANNCLIRYDLTRSPRGGYSPTEGESNVGNVKNMLEVLCESRQVPDIEFFINRRDFPLLTRDSTEPYNNIWDGHIPLVSHSYSKYCPILSMTTSVIYADIAMPTWEDWARIQGPKGVWFPKSCRNYNETFNNDWSTKLPTAVFRGGTTGCGVTPDTNPRLKLALLGSKDLRGDDGIPLLNSGVTNWNLRPRKLQGQKYLQTIDISKLPFTLSQKMSPLEQSNYKYIINAPGHVAAFRLSIELNMGSVVLLVSSPWKLWYSDLLIPYIHYVPVKSDLSDLIEQIKWCKTHDIECQNIVRSAKTFFYTYLQSDGALDYMQKILVQHKKAMGDYIYNTYTPLQLQIQEEYASLEYPHPSTNKSISDITLIPPMPRCLGLLKGIQWIINMIINSGQWSNFTKDPKVIMRNKLSIVNFNKIAGFPIVIKNTQDPIKIMENIHEVYIGINSINNLHTYIPNFAYIFALHEDKGTYSVITEYIKGITLSEYIKSTTFKFDDFLLIVIQLCYSLHMAQQHCGLIHYDLTPWNIMIQQINHIHKTDYLIKQDYIARVNTSIIPIVIDYGKSHVIHKNNHHGFINMFHSSTVQDILTLLVTCIDQISTDQRNLTKTDFHTLLQLANFITNTKYRMEPFTTAKDLREFLSRARKYSSLVSTTNKYELEKRTPLDLVEYIMTLKYQTIYKSVEIIKNGYKSSSGRGNPKQVFDYILSRTTPERIETYLDIFQSFKRCTIPQPNNIFFIYYTAQTIRDNLKNVYQDLEIFLHKIEQDGNTYIKIYKDTMAFIDRVYMKSINSKQEEIIDYVLTEKFNKLEQAPYDEETFLIPNDVLQLILSSDKISTDLTDYKDIIELILINDESYKLSDKTKQYYIKHFKNLLELNTLNMKTSIANTQSLLYTAENIYKKDLNYLNKYPCLNTDIYNNLYTMIFLALQTKKQS
jgi:hypothetical protein